MNSNTTYDYASLPEEHKLIIQLIKEELRNKKLMNGLSDLGFDTTSYSSQLSDLILNLMNFDESDDELYMHYLDLMNEQIARIEVFDFQNSLNKASIRVFHTLIAIL